MVTPVHAAFDITIKKCDFRNGPRRGEETKDRRLWRVQSAPHYSTVQYL